jgi:hypothetical protein
MIKLLRYTSIMTKYVEYRYDFIRDAPDIRSNGKSGLCDVKPDTGLRDKERYNYET